MKVDEHDGSVNPPDQSMPLNSELTHMATCTICSGPNIHCRFTPKNLLP